MKKIISFLIIAFFFIPINVFAKEEVTIHLFHLNSCPHCAKEKEFLNNLSEEYNINIVKYEVSINEVDNNTLLNKIQEITNTQTTSVPYTVIGNEIFMGFNTDIQEKIRETVINYVTHNIKIDMVKDIKDGNLTMYNYELKKQEYEKIIADAQIIEEEKTFTLPFFGKVTAKGVSLPILAIVIGAIDGFNPCAMWVLLFLISMLFQMKDRRKMWILGLAFLISSALVYLLFMVAWLKIAVTLTHVFFIRTAIAVVAIGGGVINLRSFCKELKSSGCTVVDDKKRKKIFNRIKAFTTEKSFILALIGVVILAFSVNLVELACSAGLPLLFTQILALNNLGVIHYMIYILIYIFFFLIDDIIVFVVAMCTLKLTGITTKYNSWSHLIGGVIMIIIGLLLIFKPGILMFSF